MKVYALKDVRTKYGILKTYIGGKRYPEYIILESMYTQLPEEEKSKWKELEEGIIKYNGWDDYLKWLFN